MSYNKCKKIKILVENKQKSATQTISVPLKEIYGIVGQEISDTINKYVKLIIANRTTKNSTNDPSIRARLNKNNLELGKKLIKNQRLVKKIVDQIPKNKDYTPSEVLNAVQDFMDNLVFGVVGPISEAIANEQTAYINFALVDFIKSNSAPGNQLSYTDSRTGKVVTYTPKQPADGSDQRQIKEEIKIPIKKLIKENRLKTLTLAKGLFDDLVEKIGALRKAKDQESAAEIIQAMTARSAQEIAGNLRPKTIMDNIVDFVNNPNMLKDDKIELLRSAIFKIEKQKSKLKDLIDDARGLGDQTKIDSLVFRKKVVEETEEVLTKQLRLVEKSTDSVTKTFSTKLQKFLDFEIKFVKQNYGKELLLQGGISAVCSFGPWALGGSFIGNKIATALGVPMAFITNHISTRYLLYMSKKGETSKGSKLAVALRGYACIQGMELGVAQGIDSLITKFKADEVWNKGVKNSKDRLLAMDNPNKKQIVQLARNSRYKPASTTEFWSRLLLPLPQALLGLLMGKASDTSIYQYFLSNVDLVNITGRLAKSAFVGAAATKTLFDELNLSPSEIEKLKNELEQLIKFIPDFVLATLQLHIKVADDFYNKNYEWIDQNGGKEKFLKCFVLSKVGPKAFKKVKELANYFKDRLKSFEDLLDEMPLSKEQRKKLNDDLFFKVINFLKIISDSSEEITKQKCQIIYKKYPNLLSGQVEPQKPKPSAPQGTGTSSAPQGTGTPKKQEKPTTNDEDNV